jgi:ABC-2 type transport system ATP-binding protein
MEKIKPEREIMNQELAIETVKLSRSFREKDAVKSLDLQVPKGSIFALLGTNGAGKTTTIKMLMNILRPTSGHSAVMGVDSYRLGPENLTKLVTFQKIKRCPSG